MTEKTVFLKHFTALFLLFFISDAIILLPKGQGKSFLFGAVAAAVCGFLIYFVSLTVCDKLIAVSGGIFKKAVSEILLAAASVYSLFCAANTFSLFTDFAAKVMLNGSSKVLSVLIFAAVTAFFCTRRQEDILKFCLLSAVFSVAILILFFALNTDKYNFKGLEFFVPKSYKEILSASMPYMKTAVFPSILLSVYQKLVFSENDRKAGSFGYIVSNVVLLCIILFSLLIFSSGFAASLEFPFGAAVSTVSAGRLFTRMDGLSYFIYFASAVTRVTACIFIAVSCLKKIG